MKFKKTAIFVITLIMLLAFAACSSQPKTIEDYIAKDKDMQQDINETADQAGMKVDVKENTITYTYDISNLSDDITDELAKSDELKASMETALDGAASTFVGLCKQLEDETKIKGVKMVVKYVYNDYVITERTFTSESN